MRMAERSPRALQSRKTTLLTATAEIRLLLWHSHWHVLFTCMCYGASVAANALQRQVAHMTVAQRPTALLLAHRYCLLLRPCPPDAVDLLEVLLLDMQPVCPSTGRPARLLHTLAVPAAHIEKTARSHN